MARDDTGRADEIPRNEDEEEKERRLARIRSGTIVWLLFLFVGMLTVGMATTGRGAGIVFVLGCALASGGAVIGMLFALPKARTSQTTDQENTQHATSEAAASEKPDSTLYSANTSLDQISDWLTKIIVGVGLVEAERIATFVWQGATTLGGELNHAEPHLDADAGTAVATGMIIGFPLMGFLIAFFSIKLYVARAIHAGDKEILGPTTISRDTKKAIEKQRNLDSKVPDDARTEITQPGGVDAVDHASLESALRVPVAKLRTQSDWVARGRAALLSGRFEDAATAFNLAISQGNADAALLLDYARALSRLQRTPNSRIIELLEEARQKLNSSVEPEIRRQVMWELMNAYLYADPPGGFSTTMRLADEYIAREGGNEPFAWVYRACAHGQAYSYYKKLDPETAHREAKLVSESIENALDAARRDSIEDGIRRWLNSLTDPLRLDNDLAEWAKDFPKDAARFGLGAGGETE
jgi:hypothetical protein